MLAQESKNPIVNQNELRKAAAMIEDRQNFDRFPDLADLLLEERKKQNTSAVSEATTPKWNFIQSESFKNLPDFMLQQYESMQISSFMGIFPEINRTWMTIDNTLYLWDYEQNDGTFNTHQDPDQLIVNCALVKPIPGVFLEQIEYLLIVSTPLEITILGLAFEKKKKDDEPRGACTIYPTDMSCHADGVNMSSIVGTKNGRVFMRGNDGQLFELVYQANDGWFTRKVRKLNKSGSSLSVFIPSIFNWSGNDPIKLISLDDERNILYTVSKNNQIEVISLGQDGTEFNSIAKISDLSDQLSRLNSFDDFVVSIHPLSYSESLSLSCVAVTSSGFRLYFATTFATPQYSTTSNQVVYIAPNTLQLRYVLAPPASAPITQKEKLHISFYSMGLTVASQVLEQVDRVMVFAPHAGSIMQLQPKFINEYASVFDVEGRTWAFAESPSKFISDQLSPSSLGYCLNELSTQFEYKPRKLFLLTNGGLTTLVKLRPIDLLLKLINSTPVGDSRPFVEFGRSFGHDQTCAMSLAIACGHSSISDGQLVVPHNVSSMATKLFFEMGNAPTKKQPQYLANPGGPLGIPVTAAEIIHSAKHNGLVLYTARILKGVWKEELVKSKKVNDTLVFDTNFSIKPLISIQLNLQALDRFLKQYPKLTAPPTPDTRPAQGDQEAWKHEQQSFHNIHDLITRSIEAIAFLAILIDFRIPNITASMTEQERKDLRGMTFEMLLISEQGKKVAKSLMGCLVNTQINKEIGVEAVIVSLQQRCPSICESSDVILFKGNEHLRNALSVANQSSANQHLQEALRLFSSIIKNIPAEQLVAICDQFKQMKFYNGIVDLALSKAAEYGFDAENTTEMYQRRQQCYNLIFDALANVSASTENSAGRVKDELLRIKHATLTRALASNDVEFHNSLYSWFIAENQIDTLLEIRSPFLEQFLVNGKDNLQIADYLASFYIRNNRFFDAAKLFANVAHYPALPLDTRISYLTNAITNARSSSGADTQEILSQLTDELDVARVQSEILAQLSCMPDKDEECAHLNEELLDIGALFQDARNNYLYETMLHIFFISDHSNDKSQLYIQDCWEGIITKILTNSANPIEELADKIKELGRKFYPDENVYSLKFLISRLESLTFDYIVNRSMECDRNWVCRAFLDIRIPHSRIFAIYQGLYEAKLPPWSPGNALVFLIESTLFLIERWFDHIRSPSVSMYERDEFPARLIDEALSKYLMNDGVSGRRVMVEQLTLIQKRVRVLF